MLESEQKEANVKANIYVHINICIHFLENAYLNNVTASCTLYCMELSREIIALLELALLNRVFHYVARGAFLKNP